jgi:diguanylate cyclase (GGDEF)-like protein
VRPQRELTEVPAEGPFVKFTQFCKSVSSGHFLGSATIPLPVYRDFVDMLYSMWLPIFGLGVVFVGVCLLAALKVDEPIYVVLAALGVLTTFLRLASLHGYVHASPVGDLKGLHHWERRYAIGSYASAVLIALLNVVALTVHYPLLHLITVSLVFSFGAGVVARISIRPRICVVSLLLATVPTVAALAFHAFSTHSDTLHTEMFLIEAMLVAMITGLSLHTVAYLYRSAVEHHTARHDLTQLAKYDALTGLANRLLLRERFQLSVAAATRKGHILAVHFLDLDGFKAVNDRYGHPIGDALLEQVACRLEAIVRAGDTVARLGGDEFVVLQGGLLHEDEAKMLARRIIRQLSLPYEVNDSVMSVSVSVGIATAPQQGIELERLLACADAALYRAKADGKARAIFCTFDDAASVYLAA